MSENKRLDHENKVLKAAEAQRVKNKNELDLATSKLHSMMEDQQILNKTLNEQYDKIEMNKEEVEKLRLEITVIVADKTMIKRELGRVNGLYTKLQRDNKEQREQYNALVDEVSQINQQNSTYRALLIENEAMQAKYQNEIRKYLQTIDMQKKLVDRFKEEKEIMEKKMKKVLKEMRDNSDSESAEQIDLKVALTEAQWQNQVLEDRVLALPKEFEQ